MVAISHGYPLFNMANPNINRTDNLSYIRSVLKAFQDLKRISDTKNKTKKILAFVATHDIFMQRIKATEQALIACASDNGLSVGDINIQRLIYDPILEYWSDILATN